MLNLLPAQQKRELKKEYIFRLLSVILVVFSILSLLATALLFPNYMISKSKEAFFENELENFNKDNEDLSSENLENIIEEINQSLVLLNKNNNNNMSASDVVDIILKLKPNYIKIDQIFYTQKEGGINNIDIYGVAPDRKALNDFKTILEKSDKFSGIDLPISNFVKKTDVDFKITLNTKPYEK